MGDKVASSTSANGVGRKKSVADMLSMWEHVNANTNARVRYHKTELRFSWRSDNLKSPYNSISISIIDLSNSWFKPNVGTTGQQLKDRRFPNRKTSDVSNTIHTKTSFQKSSSGMASTSDKELPPKQKIADDDIKRMSENIEVPKSTSSR